MACVEDAEGEALRGAAAVVLRVDEDVGCVCVAAGREVVQC